MYSLAHLILQPSNPTIKYPQTHATPRKIRDDMEKQAINLHYIEKGEKNEKIIYTDFNAIFVTKKKNDNQYVSDNKTKKYPLMILTYKQMDHTETNEILLSVDILEYIDGVSEHIINGHLKQLQGQLVSENYYNSVPRLMANIVTLYYFNVYERSLYLYPEYANSKNLNDMLLFEPDRITKYPNIAFHDKTQQLAIGTTLRNSHCMFLYDLNLISKKEMKLKSSHAHSSSITACEFSRNGTFLITYTAVTVHESILQIWDIGAGEQEIIKLVEMVLLNANYPLIQHLMNVKLKWSADGVILQPRK